jgi:hypothetical protein
MAGEEPKSSKKPGAGANVGDTSRAESLGQAHPAAKGVSILGFRLQSSAREAGMKKGDVIIEYDGVRNLTTETLSSLTAAARPEGIGINVVFLRDGQQDTLRVPSGPLGISAMDTTIQGRLGSKTALDKIERIVTLIQRAYLAFAVLGVVGLLSYLLRWPGVGAVLQVALFGTLDGVAYFGLRYRKSWAITLVLIISIFGCLGMFVQILQPADEIKALLAKVLRVLILLFFAYQIYFFRKPEVRTLFADRGYLVF